MKIFIFEILKFSNPRKNLMSRLNYNHDVYNSENDDGLRNVFEQFEFFSTNIFIEFK
jgi:hypothetical protein